MPPSSRCSPSGELCIFPRGIWPQPPSPPAAFLNLSARCPGSPLPPALNHAQRSSLKGTLHLVDLAGSERLSRSKVSGDRLKETVAINKSLSSLTDVFVSISNKNSHVRESVARGRRTLRWSRGARLLEMRP